MTTRRQLAQVAPGVSVASLGLLLLVAGPWQATASDEKLKAYGKHLAQECTGCHRLDGIDNGIPSIVGWKADTFIATLKFYQAGSRTNPVMVSVANSLNEKQLEALATYFGSLPKPTPKAPAPGKRSSRQSVTGPLSPLALGHLRNLERQSAAQRYVDALARLRGEG